MLLDRNKLIAFVDGKQITFDLPVNQAKFLDNLKHEAVGRAHCYLKPKQVGEFTKALRMIADYVDGLHDEKKDYSGDYSSTTSFVKENSLEEEAERLFGKEWEADDDVNQIQELLNNIVEGYVVKSIEEKTERDTRVDDYIQVFKIVSS